MNTKVIICIYQTLYYFCTADLAIPHVDNCIEMLNIIHVQTKGTIAWYSSVLHISVKLAVIGFPVYLAVWLMNVPLKGVLIGRFLSIFLFQFQRAGEITNISLLTLEEISMFYYRDTAWTVFFDHLITLIWNFRGILLPPPIPLKLLVWIYLHTIF